jgi:hypothetical protein
MEPVPPVWDRAGQEDRGVDEAREASAWDQEETACALIAGIGSLIKGVHPVTV